jgi:hypothetical protein
MFVKDERTKSNPNKFRVIKNFSHVHNGESMNDHCTILGIVYMTIRAVVAAMTPFGFFFLIDISQAFRTCCVHPSQAIYLVYSRFGLLFQDLRLPWGLRPSSEIFCRLTALIRLMILAQGFTGLYVYCDDFFGAQPTIEQANLLFEALKALLLELGFTWKLKKCLPPAQTQIWLGFVFQSNHDGEGGMRITMDPEKLTKLRNMLRTLTNAPKLSTKLMEKVIGLAVHLAQTAFGAKGFYRHMIRVKNLMLARKSVPPSASQGMKNDARYWQHEVQKHDGTSIIIEKPAIANMYLATDAALGKVTGIGYFYDGKYLSIAATTIPVFLSKLKAQANPYQRAHLAKTTPFRAKVPESWNIAYLELFAIWWTVTCFPEVFRNRYLPIRIDNTNSTSWIHKQTALPPYLAILRPLLEVMRNYNIRVYPIDTRSLANHLADAASRGATAELQELLPRWRLTVDTTLHVPLPNHASPGPLFIWRKGYYDRDVPDAWDIPYAELEKDDDYVADN